MDCFKTAASQQGEFFHAFCKFRHSYSPLNSPTRSWAQRAVLNDTGAPENARMRYDGVR